eukprot:2932682-Amphidinium_carterae.1
MEDVSMHQCVTHGHTMYRLLQKMSAIDGIPHGVGRLWCCFLFCRLGGAHVVRSWHLSAKFAR